MKFSLIAHARGTALMSSVISVLWMCSARAQETEVQPAADQPAARTAPSASTQVRKQASSESGADATDWLFQLRAGLGEGRLAGESNVRSDRLGVGVFAGRKLSEIEINLPFLDSAELNAGLSYQTFTGVDSKQDRSWVAQSIGAQGRVNVSPFSGKQFDLAIQAGVALQRMVQAEPLRRMESVKYGAGLTAGGYARTLAYDGVHALGGVEVVMGSANWLGLTLGLESSF